VKTISIVTPCYNEEGNVRALCDAVRRIMSGYPQYAWEHIFIDNDSKDRTVTILKSLCAEHSNLRLIVNSRNFGHIRSPFHGLLQARGDAAILLMADFQDSPDLIRTFISKWEEGYRIVKGVKTGSRESALMFLLRKIFYGLIGSLSEVSLTPNFTGFGLYDRTVLDILRKMDDPYPYFRGLISEIGFEQAEVPYTQERRKRGITKNNFFTLYDMALLGIINHSKLPLRIATMAGFVMSGLSLLVALVYLVLKLVFWHNFQAGLAPILIGVFFFSSIQLFFIGILGEYIGAIHTQVQRRPLVVEKERVNFD
jgi:glycosyltransferase involved in cell wall biosynthesis